MQINFNVIDRTLIARIEGELDHHTSIKIREKLDKEISRSRVVNLIFDFENLKFMDSSGIGVVIGRYKNIQKLNGRISLTGLSPHVERIVNISGLHKIVPVYNDVKQALKEM